MPAPSEQTREKIIHRMKEAFNAVHVEVVDETWRHAGHAGAMSGGGHFILRVVSDKFDGVGLLDRNRMVFGALQREMGGEIHALSIKALTPAEWSRG
jgi:BolA protein